MAELLSPNQSAALFDILTHYDTYAEIREFRRPGSLAQYGPPFTTKEKQPSTSPALQILVSKFLLTLPGLRNLPEDFWKVQCQDIIENLEKANLSESYDKGVIGSRKTLATAVSALIEYPVRGTYGGFPEIKNHSKEYDITSAADLSRGFRDFLNDAIHGDVLDKMVAKTAETDDLEDHDSQTKAVHEYVLVNLASLMHYTLILSPKGQYLLKLVDNANKLVPYLVLKQTLKIGNVASMLQAMVKVGLAKMSVASVTNWMGLTQTQDEGMNLMQTIISTVLNWDIKELDSRASKLERERAKFGKEQLRCLKHYTTKPQEQQDQIRKESQKQSMSIVTAILKDANSPSTELTDSHHAQALEYLSVHLSIRDRKQLVKCLCRSTPDHLTTSVRQLVDAYEPVIRRMHKAIDLSSTLADFEYFLKDLIKLARIQVDKGGKSVVPTVGDFVQLLRKHQRSCHVFMHQCCKNDKELTAWYLDWAKAAARQFKREPGEEFSPDATAMTEKGAGSLTPSLLKLFASLPQDTQDKIVPILDSHSRFLSNMHEQSSARLANVLKSPPTKNPAISKIFSSSASRPNSRPSSPAPGIDRKANSATPVPPEPAKNDAPDFATPEIHSSPGPGAFLARWQTLLDATPITPLTQTGTLNAASSPEIVQSSAKDVDGSTLVQFGSKEARGDEICVEPTTASTGTATGADANPAKAPDGLGQNTRQRQAGLRIVVDALGSDFRKLLAEKGCAW
ncbi:uncharacterized protein A1O9_11863 [Exophiala aquamarina CBS 119918]|uniref:Succinate dehydrogenase (Ubiquinone) flavoprotein subunit n=1 Tax=Exophiala aquamarina CBS 119918 TaxID=1182545 RepID=A0A072NXD3_9EURO|nr:uncharacterized protein A1O9_11863 [Exophiala aquamarina CBS 119918]KEF52236.1 hypothetical protein A1O9_11863 [Exophiala aquamarina CBS 119918]